MAGPDGCAASQCAGARSARTRNVPKWPQERPLQIMPSIHHSLTRKVRIIVPIDETQRRRRTASRAAREQLLHGVARLEARRGAFLPPGDGTLFRIDEPLLEDVVEDVLEVEEVRGVADVDELRGHLFARARRLVVRDER